MHVCTLQYSVELQNMGLCAHESTYMYVLYNEGLQFTQMVCTSQINIFKKLFLLGPKE